MKFVVLILTGIALCGCGSTLDPFAGHGPFPVSSSGRTSVAYYASSDGVTVLKIDGGFLIGGHVFISTTGGSKDSFHYVGVLGQDSGGEYVIVTPSTRAFLAPKIEFEKDLMVASFSWIIDIGHRHHARLYRQ